MSNTGYFTQRILGLSIGDPACPTGPFGKGTFPRGDIYASSSLAEIQLKFSPCLRSPTVGHVHCHMGLSEQVSTANGSHHPMVLIWRSGSYLTGTTRFRNNPPDVPTETLDMPAPIIFRCIIIFEYFSSYRWGLDSIEC